MGELREDELCQTNSELLGNGKSMAERGGGTHTMHRSLPNKALLHVAGIQLAMPTMRLIGDLCTRLINESV